MSTSRILSIFLLGFLLNSCSTTTFKDFFSGDDSTEERNEELMKDFKVEDDVLSKFKENKEPSTEPKKPKEVSEKKEEPKTKPKVIKPKKVLKKKASPKTNKRQVKAPKKKVQQKVAPKPVSPYHENFPEKLKVFDKKSSSFWSKFNPNLVSGESVVLDVNYMGVSTGKITISTQPETRLGEEDVYHVRARVKTADFYSYLYEVDDLCDSYIAKKNFIPLKFSLIQRQSSQDIDDLQLFDHAKLKTYTFYKRVTDKKTSKKKNIEDIPLYFQDPLSIFYFIRGLPMDAHARYEIPIVNKGKVELMVVDTGATETIKTKIGTKEAYKLKISTKHKGKTIEGGKMTFWFSKDDRRIFLRFKAKIKIGSVSGEIEEYNR